MAKKQEQKTEEKKHPGGRPRKFGTPEEMQIVIDKYFEDNPKPTICGLALALGFAQRKSLLNYEGYGEEFPEVPDQWQHIDDFYYHRQEALESSAEQLPDELFSKLALVPTVVLKVSAGPASPTHGPKQRSLTYCYCRSPEGRLVARGS